MNSIEFENYVKNWRNYLQKQGMDEEFSRKAASLIVACSYYGIQPQITSIFRSAAQQKALVDAYKKGTPGIYTPLPPGKSLHGNTTWWGAPASLAMDMVVNNTTTSSYLAKYYGITWGGARDPVHYASRGGTL